MHDEQDLMSLQSLEDVLMSDVYSVSFGSKEENQEEGKFFPLPISSGFGNASFVPIIPFEEKPVYHEIRVLCFVRKCKSGLFDETHSFLEFTKRNKVAKTRQFKITSFQKDMYCITATLEPSDPQAKDLFTLSGNQSVTVSCPYPCHSMHFELEVHHNSVPVSLRDNPVMLHIDIFTQNLATEPINGCPFARVSVKLFAAGHKHCTTKKQIAALNSRQALISRNRGPFVYDEFGGDFSLCRHDLSM